MYSDLNEAFVEKRNLINRIQSIDGQLAERALNTDTLSDEEFFKYKQWRTSACRAKQGLILLLQKTKEYIVNKRKELDQERLAKLSPVENLLEDLYQYTKSIIPTNMYVSPKGQKILEDVRVYLSTR